MNIKAAEFLVEAANESGIEAEIYEGYSGRGMCGEETTGVTTPDPIKLLGVAIAYALSLDVDETGFDERELGSLKTDSMGRESILY